MMTRWLRIIKIWWTFLRFGLYDPVFSLPFLHYFSFLKSILALFNRHRQTPFPIRIRLALESLGPTFIKFGQALSTRYDLFDKAIVDELVKLQDQVPTFANKEAIEVIETSLKASISEVFSEFDEKPLAAASIAQVYAARLKTGEQVVIKVVRPDIRKVILRDISLMETVAKLLERYYEDGKRLKPIEVVEEYSRTILNELDLTIEAANGTQLRANFKDSPIFYVPKIYWQYTRKNILVMERITGVPVGDVETLKALGVDIPLLAKRSVEIFFTQVFKHSFFHADMHPGNIFVDVSQPEDPTYIALDFGIMGTLNEEDKNYLASNFLAFFNRDYLRVAELHVESGWVPPDTSITDFEAVIRALCEPIFNKPLKDISFGHFLFSLFQTAKRFKMEVQPQLILLQKTLFAVEGVGRKLYPELDLWSTAKPFLVNFVKEQRSAKATFKRYQRDFPQWISQFPEVMHNSNIALLRFIKGETKVLLHDEVWREYAAQKRLEVYRLLVGLVGLTFLVFLLISLEKSFVFSAKNLMYGGLSFIAFFMAFKKKIKSS